MNLVEINQRLESIFMKLHLVDFLISRKGPVSQALRDLPEITPLLESVTKPENISEPFFGSTELPGRLTDMILLPNTKKELEAIWIYIFKQLNNPNLHLNAIKLQHLTDFYELYETKEENKAIFLYFLRAASKCSKAKPYEVPPFDRILAGYRDKVLNLASINSELEKLLISYHGQSKLKIKVKEYLKTINIYSLLEIELHPIWFPLIGRTCDLIESNIKAQPKHSFVFHHHNQKPPEALQKLVEFLPKASALSSSSILIPDVSIKCPLSCAN